jgi:phosphatidate cytidylyltransferase
MPDEMAPKTPGPNQPGGGPAALAAAAARNLQERIASSIVMAAVALIGAYAGVLPFALLLIGVAVLMSWEWGHMIRATDVDPAFGVHAVAVAIAISLAAAGFPLLAVTALLVGAIAVYVLTQGHRAGLSAFGIVYVGLAAVAMVWLRRDGDLGMRAVMFVFLVVWTTDIMAFTFGRAIGGQKLWPAVSPNKTWSGFLGGVGSSALVSALFSMVVPGANWGLLAAVGLVLGIVAQAGDLAESALKRQFGFKDASHIIPGHGGVMDRMDGIVAVAAAAGLLALVVNPWAPAAALLFGG